MGNAKGGERWKAADASRMAAGSVDAGRVCGWYMRPGRRNTGRTRMLIGEVSDAEKGLFTLLDRAAGLRSMVISSEAGDGRLCLTLCSNVARIHDGSEEVFG